MSSTTQTILVWGSMNVTVSYQQWSRYDFDQLDNVWLVHQYIMYLAEVNHLHTPVKCVLEGNPAEECKVNNLPVKSNLNLAHFTGMWYSRYRLHGTSTWHSGKVHLQQTSETDLTADYGFSEWVSDSKVHLCRTFSGPMVCVNCFCQNGYCLISWMIFFYRNLFTQFMCNYVLE